MNDLVHNSDTQNSQFKIDGNVNLTSIFAMIGFAFSFSNVIVGLVLSVIALKRYKKQQSQQYKALAITGIIMSACTLISIISSISICLFALFIDFVLSLVYSYVAF